MRGGQHQLLTITLILAALIPVSGRTETSTLEKRIVVLEEALDQLRAESEVYDGNVGQPLEFSGYADAEYHLSDRAGAHSGFRLHHLSLFTHKQIDERWRFFSEIEYEDGPRFEAGSTRGRIFVEALNIDYHLHGNGYLRLGRFFTPAGIWSIDHYPPFVPTQRRPQHIRKIFPQVVDGLTLNHRLQLSSMFLDIDLYLGNGENASGSGDNNDGKAIGGRLNFDLPWLQRLETGVSLFHDRPETGLNKNAVGIHFKGSEGPVTIQSEYAWYREGRPSLSTRHKRGYYLQALYRTGAWMLGYRFDRMNTVGQAIDIDSLFANYHFNKDVVAKIEHHWLDDRGTGEDSQEMIASIVLYLGR